MLRSMHHTTPALSAYTTTTSLMDAAQMGNRRTDTGRQMDGQTKGQTNRQIYRHTDSVQAITAHQIAQVLDMLSFSRYNVMTSEQSRYHELGLQTHGDSGSSRAVVHQGQLPKGTLIMVLKQQLLLISLRLGDLEVAALYDVKVVALLSFPRNSWQKHLTVYTLLLHRSGVRDAMCNSLPGCLQLQGDKQGVLFLWTEKHCLLH